MPSRLLHGLERLAKALIITPQHANQFAHSPASPQRGAWINVQQPLQQLHGSWAGGDSTATSGGTLKRYWQNLNFTPQQATNPLYTCNRLPCDFNSENFMQQSLMNRAIHSSCAITARPSQSQRPSARSTVTVRAARQVGLEVCILITLHAQQIRTQ